MLHIFYISEEYIFKKCLKIPINLQIVIAWMLMLACWNANRSPGS